jgi:hypothetical protein
MQQKSLTRFRSLQCDNLKSKIENLKWVGIVAFAVAFALCGAMAQAQQPAKIARIGYLTASPPSANLARMEAFRKGEGTGSSEEEKMSERIFRLALIAMPIALGFSAQWQVCD